jgi:hypothetical protein
MRRLPDRQQDRIRRPPRSVCRRRAQCPQVSAKVEGSIEKANQSQADRAKIRTVLGSDIVQVAELK